MGWGGGCQALTTILGFGYEVAIAASTECGEALVGHHRADAFVNGVIDQRCGQGLARLGVQGASFILNKLTRHE